MWWPFPQQAFAKAWFSRVSLFALTRQELSSTKTSSVVITLNRYSYGFEFNLELICTSEVFKKLTFHEPLRQVQFQLLRKNSQVQINFKLNKKTPYDYLLIIQTGKIRMKEVPEDVPWSHFFAFEKSVLKVSVQNFCHCFTWCHWLTKFLSLTANHNPELQCVICTGVTLFAAVLHLNYNALNQSESSSFFHVYY